MIFRRADLIIYDTGEPTEEVHQGSAEIRLFTEETLSGGVGGRLGNMGGGGIRGLDW